MAPLPLLMLPKMVFLMRLLLQVGRNVDFLLVCSFPFLRRRDRFRAPFVAMSTVTFITSQ